MTQQLVFLKLGGSLITDKANAHTANLEVIRQLARELVEVRSSFPGLHILLGHGSGSFGHVPAARYGTRDGVHNPEDWQGFVEVWQEARALNCILTQELIATGLPAITFSPCSQVIVSAKQIIQWDVALLTNALHHGLLPIVHGDTVFDLTIAGTILSTEELFTHLATQLHPDQILIAGIEKGIWADYPNRKKLIDRVTPATLPETNIMLGGSEHQDVTGGMYSKVSEMCALVAQGACKKITIFSGKVPGNIHRILAGEKIGTVITTDGKD
jgi:isopentenyl phosphate kinase